MSLNQLQYEAIMKDYDYTRETNRLLRKERFDQIYHQIPQMQELDDELPSIARNRVKTILDSASQASQSTPDSFAQIAIRRKRLLQEAGFPAEYLDPIYTCSDCKDTGYLLSKEGWKEKCHCFKKKELALLFEQSNIQDVLSRENFSTLSYDYCEGEDLEHLKRAVSKSLAFVKSFPAEQQNLLFYGTVGTGKSFLSGCIARELLLKGYSVIYFSSANLFETLARYSFDTKEKETLYNFYKDLYNYDCVIIDDLGTELTNSFVTSQLFSFLNERQIRGRATIISTNLNLEELRDRYSDRVFSRITSSFTICKLTGPDVRMSKKSL